MAQAIGVKDFHDVLCNAMATRKLCYAIFNSSNIREFIYGVGGTAKITMDLDGFSPEGYLERWVAEHFSACHESIRQCYHDYFQAFEKNSRGVAVCNDGLMLHRCRQSLQKINKGERDKELELMISYCLQLFASEKDKAFLTQEQEDAMFDEFEFKSYAERRFVQDVFAYGDEIAELIEDNDNYTDVDVGKWFITYQDNSDVQNPGDASDNKT
ncbi:MAG: hypothetical protein J6W23_13550, partial [Victivallales bacterium]|nr:hypothetical protein [Victivallales bacterium]